MQNETFHVLNVKCAGCVSAIEKGLNELGNIRQVQVDIKAGQVQVEGDELERARLSAKLSELGYPEA